MIDNTMIQFEGEETYLEDLLLASEGAVVHGLLIERAADDKGGWRAIPVAPPAYVEITPAHPTLGPKLRRQGRHVRPPSDNQRSQQRSPESWRT